MGLSGREICPVLRTSWPCFHSVPLLGFMCLFVVLGKCSFINPVLAYGCGLPQTDSAWNVVGVGGGLS